MEAENGNELRLPSQGDDQASSSLVQDLKPQLAVERQKQTELNEDQYLGLMKVIELRREINTYEYESRAVFLSNNQS